MFSGIVEEVGVVKNIENRQVLTTLEISCSQTLTGSKLGDSIAVNGACLTVTHLTTDFFTVEVVPETLRRTNLGNLTNGQPVNLERSLAVGARIGGHFVQGHVDGIGFVQNVYPEGEAVVVVIHTTPEIMRYIVTKGFITIDGTSLTIVECWSDSFSVSLIPFTMQHTISGNYCRQSQVNLEVDILGKYVEKFVCRHNRSSSIDRNFLSEHGFI